MKILYLNYVVFLDKFLCGVHIINWKERTRIAYGVALCYIM